ncbi:PEP-CTERM sorting domain-containing protein [Massilia sp. 9096]|uniref:PEP-CTERM sorting domain-containing protein n=1 Tax=Massilia sp. 9096 TaxID=1500894 RepID=UPI00055A0685|nr:PEP-CTERM sorting domain-containing protein [Massilia sp. 9096]
MRFKSALLAIATVASLSAIGSGNATELITNGNFDGSNYGQIGWNGNTLQGWNTTGYNFLFNTSNDEVYGTNGANGAVRLWGWNNGGLNNLVASPTGGNYVAADGAYGVAPLTQTINGLTVGQQYNLTFYWAGAQQYGYDGITTDRWKVTLGNETYSTAIKTDASHGFTGWTQELMTFTATGTSELLSFLAIGTPSGEPPFSLLDGVSMNQVVQPTPAPTTKVPEPGTLAMIGLGLGLLSFGVRRRKSKQK